VLSGAVTVLPSESVWAALFATVVAEVGVWASSSPLSPQPATKPRAATSATSEAIAKSLRTIHTPRR
jgi:hypothetical protein